MLYRTGLVFVGVCRLHATGGRRRPADAEGHGQVVVTGTASLRPIVPTPAAACNHAALPQGRAAGADGIRRHRLADRHGDPGPAASISQRRWTPAAPASATPSSARAAGSPRATTGCCPGKPRCACRAPSTPAIRRRSATPASRSICAGCSVQLCAFGGWPAFVDVQLGQRFRTGGPPNETRVDLTFGLRTAQAMAAAGANIQRDFARRRQRCFRHTITTSSSSACCTISMCNGRCRPACSPPSPAAMRLQENGLLGGLWCRF